MLADDALMMQSPLMSRASAAARRRGRCFTHYCACRWHSAADACADKRCRGCRA
jgi:hypothetical protein